MMSTDADDRTALRAYGARLEYERSPLRRFIESAEATAAAALQLAYEQAAEIHDLRRRIEALESMMASE